MGAADLAGNENSHEDGQTPAGGDDDPARVIAFGLVQDDIGDYAVTQKDQDHGTNKLSNKVIHLFSPYLVGMGIGLLESTLPL